jgi:hypothetical protein
MHVACRQPRYAKSESKPEWQCSFIPRVHNRYCKRKHLSDMLVAIDEEFVPWPTV